MTFKDLSATFSSLTLCLSFTKKILEQRVADTIGNGQLQYGHLQRAHGGVEF